MYVALLFASQKMRAQQLLFRIPAAVQQYSSTGTKPVPGGTILVCLYYCTYCWYGTKISYVHRACFWRMGERKNTYMEYYDWAAASLTAVRMFLKSFKSSRTSRTLLLLDGEPKTTMAAPTLQVLVLHCC